jgi:hypothetical protein
MKYLSWVVIVLLSPVLVLGFFAEAVIEAFAIGRAVFQWLHEDA